MTAHLPLHVLGEVSPRFDWLVPGLREELVTALMCWLPKELGAAGADPGDRGQGAGAPGAAAAAAGGRPQPARQRAARRRDFRRLPPHLRMRFRVEDERRGVLAEGDDLADVRARVRPLRAWS